MSKKPPRKKPKREDLGPDEVLCDHCTAKCCRYFALPIDTPESPRDFDFIRWYLLHGRASVFTEDGDWYLLVHTACKHLQTDNRCLFGVMSGGSGSFYTHLQYFLLFC